MIYNSTSYQGYNLSFKKISIKQVTTCSQNDLDVAEIVKFTDVAGIMNIPYVAEKVKLSHVAEIVKLSHVAGILEAGSMYDLQYVRTKYNL